MPVEIRGSSAETLVFLPGLGVPPDHYADGLCPLVERFTVIVPDLSFRRGRSLPASTTDYLDLLTAMTDDLAPDAVWAGHSFGALLALLSRRPAIACAPSVPVEAGVPRMFGRAVHQQAREYAGLEGWRGLRFAASIAVDYVGTAALRPGALFPVLQSLRVPPETFPPRSPRAVVYLSDRDELYREREYRRYFDGAHEEIEEVRVPDCHDWPVLRPDLLATRLEKAFDRLRGPAQAARPTRLLAEG